jgi:hypothetical protein
LNVTSFKPDIGEVADACGAAAVERVEGQQFTAEPIERLGCYEAKSASLGMENTHRPIIQRVSAVAASGRAAHQAAIGRHHRERRVGPIYERHDDEACNEQSRRCC